jgi:hypothetical protein
MAAATSARLLVISFLSTLDLCFGFPELTCLLRCLPLLDRFVFGLSARSPNSHRLELLRQCNEKEWHGCLLMVNGKTQQIKEGIRGSGLRLKLFELIIFGQIFISLRVSQQPRRAFSQVVLTRKRYNL